MPDLKVILSPKEFHYKSTQVYTIKIIFKRILMSINHEIAKVQCRNTFTLKNNLAMMFGTVEFQLDREFQLANSKISIIIMASKGKQIKCLGEGVFDLVPFSNSKYQEIKVPIQKCQDPNSYLIVGTHFERILTQNHSIKKQPQATGKSIYTQAYHNETLIINRKKKLNQSSGYEISHRNYKKVQILRDDLNRSNDSIKSGSYKKRFQYQLSSHSRKKYGQRIKQQQRSTYQKNQLQPRINTPEPIGLKQQKNNSYKTIKQGARIRKNNFPGEQPKQQLPPNPIQQSPRSYRKKQQTKESTTANKYKDISEKLSWIQEKINNKKTQNKEIADKKQKQPRDFDNIVIQDMYNIGREQFNRVNNEKKCHNDILKQFQKNTEEVPYNTNQEYDYQSSKYRDISTHPKKQSPSKVSPKIDSYQQIESSLHENIEDSNVKPYDYSQHAISQANSIPEPKPKHHLEIQRQIHEKCASAIKDIQKQRDQILQKYVELHEQMKKTGDEENSRLDKIKQTFENLLNEKENENIKLQQKISGLETQNLTKQNLIDKLTELYQSEGEVNDNQLNKMHDLEQTNKKLLKNNQQLQKYNKQLLEQLRKNKQPKFQKTIQNKGQMKSEENEIMKNLERKVRDLENYIEGTDQIKNLLTNENNKIQKEKQYLEQQLTQANKQKNILEKEREALRKQNFALIDEKNKLVKEKNLLIEEKSKTASNEKKTLKELISKMEILQNQNQQLRSQKVMNIQRSNLDVDDVYTQPIIDQNRSNTSRSFLGQTKEEKHKQEITKLKKKIINLQSEARFRENQLRFMKIKMDTLKQQNKDLETQIAAIVNNEKNQLARKQSIEKLSADSKNMSNAIKTENKALKQEIGLLYEQIHKLNALLEESAKNKLGASRVAPPSSITTQRLNILEQRLQTYEQQLSNNKMKFAEIINIIWSKGSAQLIDQISKKIGLQ